MTEKQYLKLQENYDFGITISLDEINECNELIKNKKPNNWEETIDLVIEVMDTDNHPTRKLLLYAVHEFVYHIIGFYNDNIGTFITNKINSTYYK